MTVKQIREKKGENKAAKEPPEGLVCRFLTRHGIAPADYSTVQELKESLAVRYKHACGGPDPEYECTPRGISLGGCAEMTWLAFAKKAWSLTADKPEEQPEPVQPYAPQEAGTTGGNTGAVFRKGDAAPDASGPMEETCSLLRKPGGETENGVCKTDRREENAQSEVSCIERGSERSRENQKERLQYLAAGTTGTAIPQGARYGTVTDRAAR